MELNEAIKELKSRVKPYLHVGMPQSTFFNTIRNIEAGLAKQSTIDEFMGRYGYERVSKVDEWKQNK